MRLALIRQGSGSNRQTVQIHADNAVDLKNDREARSLGIEVNGAPALIRAAVLGWEENVSRDGKGQE